MLVMTWVLTALTAKVMENDLKVVLNESLLLYSLYVEGYWL
jgi:hypothetical protein